MCIVVDANCLPAVFNEESSLHTEFKPVFDWIKEGEGKLVYGGSKYTEELGRLTRSLKVVTTLGKTNKTVHISNQEVDDEQREVDKLCSHSRFNDSHLIAIILASGCRLLCSVDTSSFPFIKKKEFYAGRNPSIKKPKIYTGQKNRSLLVDENIANICKPCR